MDREQQTAEDRARRRRIYWLLEEGDLRELGIDGTSELGLLCVDHFRPDIKEQTKEGFLEAYSAKALRDWIAEQHEMREAT